jgi:hypothetical protein
VIENKLHQCLLQCFFLYIFAGRGQKIWRGLKQFERLALFLSAHALVRPVLNILQPRALLFSSQKPGALTVRQVQSESLFKDTVQINLLRTQT